jgi:hypothetical protein
MSAMPPSASVSDWDQDVRLGACPSNPSLRGKGAAGRCEAAGLEKPEQIVFRSRMVLLGQAPRH